MNAHNAQNNTLKCHLTRQRYAVPRAFAHRLAWCARTLKRTILCVYLEENNWCCGSHECTMPWILGCFSVREQGNWNPTTPLTRGKCIIKTAGEVREAMSGRGRWKRVKRWEGIKRLTPGHGGNVVIKLPHLLMCFTHPAKSRGAGHQTLIVPTRRGGATSLKQVHSLTHTQAETHMQPGLMANGMQHTATLREEGDSEWGTCGGGRGVSSLKEVLKITKRANKGMICSYFSRLLLVSITSVRNSVINKRQTLWPRRSCLLKWASAEQIIWQSIRERHQSSVSGTQCSMFAASHWDTTLLRYSPLCCQEFYCIGIYFEGEEAFISPACVTLI